MNYQELDQIRKKYAKKILICLIPAIIVLVVAMVLAFQYLNPTITGKRGVESIQYATYAIPGIFLLIPSIFFLTIIGVLITWKDARNYKKAYKKYFVEQSIRYLFNDVTYSHESPMPSIVLESTGMIDMGNRYYSNDFFSGKYKDVMFSQADVRIVREDDDSTNTLFKGRWLLFEFPKSFAFRLEVVEKGFFYSKIPAQNPRTGKTIQRISTESPEFNRNFRVYAEDGFEAFYILDPAFIEHIEALNNRHEGRIILCFVDNKLHVGIRNNKDAFEPPHPFKKLDEKKEIAKTINETKVITDFIDYLKLDKKLFKS